MAVSGSTDFTVTAQELVEGALRLAGVIATGETPSPEVENDTLQSLNMMCKTWQAQNIGLWRKQDATLLLQKNQLSYDLGPTGDHVTLSYVETTSTSDEIAGAGTIALTSVTGISSGDYFGVELDTGEMQWTTVNGAPAGLVVTLTDVLTGASSSGSTVYAYTTKIDRPLELEDMRIELAAGNEIPLFELSRGDYMELSDKTTSGITNQAYYDPQLTNGVIKVWPVPNSIGNKILFTAIRPIFDFDATNNNPDFPQEWFEPLKYNLAVRVAIEYGIPLDSIGDIMALANSTLSAVTQFDQENVSIFFQPEMRH
jgi:hypothetical protein